MMTYLFARRAALGDLHRQTRNRNTLSAGHPGMQQNDACVHVWEHIMAGLSTYGYKHLVAARHECTNNEYGLARIDLMMICHDPA